MKNILNDINNIKSKENNYNNYIICEYDIKKDKIKLTNSNIRRS